MCMHTPIDENVDSCSGNTLYQSTLPLVCNPQPDDTTTSSVIDSRSAGFIRVTITFVCLSVLALIILLLVMTIIVMRRKWIKQKQITINNDNNTYSNLSHNSKILAIRKIIHLRRLCVLASSPGPISRLVNVARKLISCMGDRAWGRG